MPAFPKINLFSQIRNVGRYHMVAVAAAIAPAVVLSTSDGWTQSNNQSCTIIVNNTPGIMRQNADTTMLSSTQAGGRAGAADIVTTNGRYRVSVDAPSGFSTFPNQGNNNTDFSASYSSTGATNFLSTPDSVDRKLKRGTSRIRINMTAKRFNGSFPAGNYSATVTLRCE